MVWQKTNVRAVIVRRGASDQQHLFSYLLGMRVMPEMTQRSPCAASEVEGLSQGVFFYESVSDS